uniref:Secreted protein n=1 Tax=Steinernema glaseri TaxID=37863 RepID=A0A1I7ZCM0_9BILA
MTNIHIQAIHGIACFSLCCVCCGVCCGPREYTGSEAYEVEKQMRGDCEDAQGKSKSNTRSSEKTEKDVGKARTE